MTQYTNPIPSGTDPTVYTDVDRVQYMRQLKEDRQDKGYAIPRFVRAVNKAGYSISLAEYKEAETFPLKGAAHVAAGMLEYAYRVLNSTRVQNSVQGPHTARAMTVIGRKRIARDLDYFELAGMLSAAGVYITEAEYRAAEQGMTKTVSHEVIMTAAKLLDLDPRELLR